MALPVSALEPRPEKLTGLPLASNFETLPSTPAIVVETLHEGLVPPVNKEPSQASCGTPRSASDPWKVTVYATVPGSSPVWETDTLPLPILLRDVNAVSTSPA